MVYALQDQGSRRWGYKIVEKSGDMERVIDEEYHWSSPTDALTFVGEMKKSISEGHMIIIRNREINSWGYQIADPVLRIVLSEEFGWSSEEEVKEHMNSFKAAILEGSKIYVPLPR
jgi:hypothetical protein